jgi:hypothetical protein
MSVDVWCSGRRGDGKPPSMWNVLDRHTWPNHQPHGRFRPCFLAGSTIVCCGHARQGQRARLFDFRITWSAEKEVNG